MRLSSVLLLCGLVAAVPSLSAQTTTAPNTGDTTVANPAPQTTSTTTSTPPAQTTTPGTAPAAPLKLESLPPEPTTLTPQQIAKLRAERFEAAATQLARNQAAWGPQRSSPGTSIEMVEASRKSTPEGIQITYTFKAKGFKVGDNLRLIRWPLDRNLATLNNGLSVDDQGQLICPAITQGDCLSSMQPGELAKLTTTAAKGEAIRVALFDTTTKQHAETTAVPFPALYSSKTCKMEMLLSVKNAALVLLEGVGFPPSKRIQIDATAYGQDHPITTTTGAQGQLLIAFMPPVAGHDSGTTTIHYDGAECKPTLTFPWGPGSYQAVTSDTASTQPAAKSAAPEATQPITAHAASGHPQH